MVLLSLPILCLGQQNGKIAFKVFPPIGKTTIRVDDKLIIDTLKVPELTFDTGQHRIELWAEYYTLKDTFFQVLPDTTTLFSFRLKTDDDYVDYRNRLKKYQGQQLFYKIPNYVAIGVLLGGISLYTTTLNYKDEIDRRERMYRKLGPDILPFAFFESQLDDYKQEIIDRRNFSYAVMGSSVLIKLFAIWKKRHYKKKYPEKPTYDKSNPFTFDVSHQNGINTIELK